MKTPEKGKYLVGYFANRAVRSCLSLTLFQAKPEVDEGVERQRRDMRLSPPLGPGLPVLLVLDPPGMVIHFYCTAIVICLCLLGEGWQLWSAQMLIVDMILISANC